MAGAAPNGADRRTAAEHDRIWRRFLRERNVAVHTGRMTVPPGVDATLVFQVPITDPELRAALGQLSSELQTSGAFSGFPDGYWHATIVPPALLTEGRADPPALLPRGFADRALETAREELRGYQPFRLHARGVNAFYDVVVGVPYEDGCFADIHRRLRRRLPELPERYFDGHEPVPHISLGQYSDLGRLDDLIRMLEANRETDLGEMTVEGIEMLVIPLANGEMGTPQRFPVPFR